jgi:hypothetical protein
MSPCNLSTIPSAGRRVKDYLAATEVEGVGECFPQRPVVLRVRGHVAINEGGCGVHLGEGWKHGDQCTAAGWGA